MTLNIPDSDKKRIVIIGAGAAGLAMARKLHHADYQVVLIDKNNYHQFQPLLYQVATSSLEPSAVSFPLRKVFDTDKEILIRVAEVLELNATANTVKTSIGELTYNFLVLAMGTTNNFFGNKHIQEHAIPMKSVAEAIRMRNTILENFEKSVLAETAEEREALLNLVVVGGGPTGTEIAGTLSEMKEFILPKDYPEMNFQDMKIFMVEGMPGVLNGMAEVSQRKAQEYLEGMGVQMRLGTQVKDYDGTVATLGDGTTIRTNNLIWAAGVTGNTLKGLKPELMERGNRIKVDEYLKVQGSENMFVIGDIAYLADEKYPKGYPQLAAVASQQGDFLARNFMLASKGKPLQKFSYFNRGTMATVGRNKAVVELPFIRYQGFFAWLTWMFVHLILSLGVKNKVFIFISWFWNYVTYNPSLRLIIKPEIPKTETVPVQ